jgi:hypothetical protein
MKIRSWMVGLCVLAATPGLPALGANLNGFMPQAGEGAVALSYSTESYDHFYRGTTRVANPPFLGEVTTESLSLWARYGFTDRFAIVGTLDYVDTSGDGSSGFADSGISDLTALGLFRLWEAPAGAGHQSLTGGIGLRVPVGDYEGDAPVSLGDDSTDGLARLVYQFQQGGFYVSQQIGYDLRGSDVPDGYPLHTEVGYSFPAGTYSTTLNLFYTRYFADDGTDIGDAGFTFPSNREEYERVGAKAYFRLAQGFGISAQGYTALDGRNTGDSTGFSLGVVAGF